MFAYQIYNALYTKCHRHFLTVSPVSSKTIHVAPRIPRDATLNDFLITMTIPHHPEARDRC